VEFSRGPVVLSILPITSYLGNLPIQEEARKGDRE
jgi:hypothetical protein